jgi:iron complex transport system substrate-binding protein
MFTFITQIHASNPSDQPRKESVLILCAFIALFFSVKPSLGYSNASKKSGLTLLRIAPLTPHLVEILQEFKEKRAPTFKIVTKTEHSPESVSLNPKAEKPTSIGNYRNFSIEKVLSSKPDLILASDQNPSHMVEKLKALELRVEVLSSLGLEESLESISRVGELLKLRNVAQKIISEIKKDIKKLDRELNNASPKKVFLALGHRPLYTVGSKGYLVDLLELARSKPLFSSSSFEYLKPGIEDIIKKNPEVILVLKFKGLSKQDINDFWASYPQIEAVKNKQIHLLDADLLGRPGPNLAEAARAIAKAIHPEVF